MSKTILLILACSLLFGGTVAPITSQKDRVADLRELLLQDAWIHTVRSGPIAIESYVLVFRKDGELSETILDDTGGHHNAGSWQLEASDDQVVLVLTGDQLRNKGRFALQQVDKEAAIEFQRVGDDRAMKFERKKGYRGKDEG
jgi:hypothetical protein